MPTRLRISKGLDIKLKGVASLVSTDAPVSGIFAISPDDFPGIVPQMSVKAGDTVLAGDVLFVSKYDNRIKFTSPVSGTVKEIVRGEKRKILHVLVESDGKLSRKDFKPGELEKLDREAIRDVLLDSGTWNFIRQRPYDIIARPEASPKAVFISSYNTVPLGCDYNYSLIDRQAQLQKGIDVMRRLTDGLVYLAVDGENLASFFRNLKGVELVNVSGPHPAGNVGVQINHIDPVNKGETVFTVNPEDLSIIGELFLCGQYVPYRKVNVAGSQALNPKYTNTYIGASISSLTNDNLKEGDTRFISGDVLSGCNVGQDGFLGFYDNMVTLIPDGSDDSRMLGWIMPNNDKLSFFRAMSFSWMRPGKQYELSANLNGGRRNFVVTGIYDKVFPMDIYPMQLIKAAITQDIEAMENLGIYEVAPEDFALCSFICPSKIDMQAKIREGLDLMIQEVGF